MDTYCIRPDYRPNRRNQTLDSVSGATFWTERRLRTSYRYQYAAYRAAHRLARQVGARTVVDLGCGVATKLNRVFGPDFDIVGVDQPSAIPVCQRLHDRGLYLAENFEEPTYEVARRVERIDLLISSDVIEHLEDPDRLLAYIKRIATPETLIVLTTPERAALLGNGALQPVNPAHIREWSFEEFRCYLESSGFQIIDHGVLLPFRLLPDAMTARFVLGRLRQRLPFRTNQMAVCRLPRQSTAG